MRISVLTPTCDRPVALAHLERYMRGQRRQPDEWIVADGGRTPATLTCGQRHVHRAKAPGVVNFAHNLLNGLASVTGDLVAIMEDDDAYAVEHLAILEQQLGHAGALIAGDDEQRYYNLARGCWRVMANTGASLCQTGFHRALIPLLERTIRECLARGSYGIDAAFWLAVPREAWRLAPTHTVVGLKGLPGCPGLGIGHRPSGHQWQPDPGGHQLRAWLGPDVVHYQRSAVA